MSPEEKSLLERTYKMVEENNTILKSIRSATRWATAFKIVYWIIIIGLSFGAYYFIQPYLQMLLGLSNTVTGSAGNLQDMASQIQSLLK